MAFPAMVANNYMNPGNEANANMCVSKPARVRVYNGAFVYVNKHMCCVVNLCQLCVAVALTSDHCVRADVG